MIGQVIDQLTIAIDSLTAARKLLLALNGSTPKHGILSRGAWRYSPKARGRMSLAQKARWAKIKARPSTIPAHRASIFLMIPLGPLNARIN